MGGEKEQGVYVVRCLSWSEIIIWSILGQKNFVEAKNAIPWNRIFFFRFYSTGNDKFLIPWYDDVNSLSINMIEIGCIRETSVCI